MKPLFTFLLLFQILSVTAQWKSLKGPNGGFIYDYQNVGISTYVSSSNGFYRSDDDGNTWNRFENDLPEFYDALGFAIDDDEIFLNFKDVSTREYHFVHSTDKGKSWTRLPLPFEAWVSFNIIYKNGLLIAYGSGIQERKLIESSDKGQTWSISVLDSSLKNIETIASNNEYFFVSNQKMLYRRALKDTLWQLIYTSPWNSYFDIIVNEHVVILTNSTNSGVRSVDNGKNWDPINIYGTKRSHTIVDFGNIMYLGVKYLYKSYDRGQTWDLIPNIYLDNLSIYFLMRAGNSLLANSLDFGLLRTEDEFKSVEKSSNGFYPSWVHRIIATDSFLFALGWYSIDRFNLITKSWDVTTAFQNLNYGNLCYYSGKLFVLSLDKLYTSNDQGKSFQEQDINFFSPPPFNRPRLFGFNGILVYSHIDGIKYSNDLGLSWYDLVIRNEKNEMLNVYDITVYDQKWIVLTQNLTGGFALYHSGDFKKWTKFPGLLPGQDPDFAAFEILTVDDKLFVKVSNNQHCRLIKYNGTGTGFTDCTGTGDICMIDSDNVMVSRNDKMILTTFNGLFESDNGGLHWSKVIDNLSLSYGSNITTLAQQNDKLYAGTFYLGAVEADWSDFPTNILDEQKSNDTQLFVLPNPGNGRFQIFGEKLNSEKMNWIRVYNLHGQCVFQTKDKITNGYKVDLSDLSAGLYILKLGNSNHLLSKIVIQY
jgi:hypothetical protein